MTSVVRLWLGYSAPCSEGAKAVARILWNAVAMLPICVEVTLWRCYMLPKKQVLTSVTQCLVKAQYFSHMSLNQYHY